MTFKKIHSTLLCKKNFLACRALPLVFLYIVYKGRINLPAKNQEGLWRPTEFMAKNDDAETLGVR